MGACTRVSCPPTLVVDAPSLLHRNHHARAHTRLTERQGQPIRALQGMLRHILESIDTIAPDVVVVVLGACRLRARGEAVVGGVHLRSHGHRSEIAWGAGKSGP